MRYKTLTEGHRDHAHADIGGENQGRNEVISIALFLASLDERDFKKQLGLPPVWSVVDLQWEHP